MTEKETKAVKWMQCVRDDAVVTLDHIAKNEPNVSPMLYAGRKEKAETIINGFEELEQYRAKYQTGAAVYEPEYMGENVAIGCRDGRCKCGNIVRSYQKFCDECGIKLDWGNTHKE